MISRPVNLRECTSGVVALAGQLMNGDKFTRLSRPEPCGDCSGEHSANHW